MGWGKLDDRHHSHRKTRPTGIHALAAVGIHALGISYSADQLTDGYLDDGWLAGKLYALTDEDRAAVLTLLEDRGLLDRVEDGWQVHDYLDCNPSRESVEKRRKADLERKAGRVRPESPQNPPGVKADSAQNPDGPPAPGRPLPRALGRDGSSTEAFIEVEELLAKLRECERFTVDDITTRVQVENAIGTYPALDHMAAAREAVIWASDPAWRKTNAGGVFLDALRKQSERKPRPVGPKRDTSKYDRGQESRRSAA